MALDAGNLIEKRNDEVLVMCEALSHLESCMTGRLDTINHDHETHTSKAQDFTAGLQQFASTTKVGVFV